MGKFGMYLIFFAIGSAILSFTNYQFRLMSWLDSMGDGAWVARAIMFGIGALMIAADSQGNQNAPAAQHR